MQRNEMTKIKKLTDRYCADGGDGSGKNRLGQMLLELQAEFRKNSLTR
jgi:predicted NAD-dependent protein-ADP-ribosyltransferase YbiA (DUF1768 family)